jgi:hypothetical protein
MYAKRRIFVCQVATSRGELLRTRVRRSSKNSPSRTLANSGKRKSWCVGTVRSSRATLLAHHQHGAVSVPDNRVRDAARKGPPYPAYPPSSHHDKTSS